MDVSAINSYDQSMGLQAIINVGYAHTIKYKLINYSWTVVSWVTAVGKGPYFLQKNPPADFSGYGPELFCLLMIMIYLVWLFVCLSLHC